MRTLLIAAICLGAALPASAEEKKTTMMKPTMEQCQGGWKGEYRDSMHWSHRKFKSACHHMRMDKH